MSHAMEPSARKARPRARFAVLAIAALLLAGPAGAARVVQVRVGEHPEFTRVVFELDAPAGYRVERKAGSAELVVTLEAASGARKLARKSSDIRAVEVEAAERAVARVRLRDPKLQLKEMILSNPPRIVLDVLREKKVVAAKTAPAPPKPAAAVKPAAETQVAVEKPAAETKTAAAPKPAAEVKPAPQPKPAETKPIAKVEPPAPAAKPIAKAEPEPAPKPAAEAKPPAPAPKPTPEAKPIAKVEPAPAPKPEAKPPAPAPKTAAETKAAEPPKLAAETKPAMEPKAVAKAEPPAPTPTPIAKAEPTPTPKPAAEAKPPVPTPPPAQPVMTADDLAKQLAAKPAEPPKPAAEAKPATEARPSEPAKPAAETAETPALPTPPPPGAVVEIAKPAEPAPAPKSAPVKPAPSAKPAKPAAEPKASAGSSWLSNPIVLGAAAGVLICTVALVLLLRRRRALPNDLDVTAIAEERGEAAEPGDAYAASDEDSFNLFDSNEPVTTPEQPTEPVSRAARAPSPAPVSAAEEDESSFASLFDDDETHGPTVSQGAAKMTQPTTSDFPTDRTGGDRTAATTARPAPAAAAAGGDVMRLVQDLERRMSALEKKLGEANEAREKLERQVAAQSEELRVQRAAIARTQRALRTMTRGEEDKATEPALREDAPGQTQSKTRINL